MVTLQPIQPTLKDAKLSCTNTRQWVCGLKMNKLIGRASHRLCTFSTSIREIREIKYYFNIWGIRKKKKEGGSEKGGVKIHPFHLPWVRVCLVHQRLKLSVLDMLCQLSGHARGVVEFSFSKWLKLIQFDFILLHSLITKTT